MIKNLIKIFLITLLLLINISATMADSIINEVKKSGEPLKPIDITSSQLEANLKSHIVIFKGDVIAKQADVILYCDILTAYYDAKNKNITKIVAENDVKITRNDMIATSKQAVYDNINKLITLTGSPRVWEGNNIIEGTKIILYIGTNKIFVEGAKALYNSVPKGIMHGSTP